VAAFERAVAVNRELAPSTAASLQRARALMH
jgi:hypothetical protein